MSKVPDVAVVGVGHMGAHHAAKLAELDRESEVRLVGIHDVDASRAEELAKRHDILSFARLEDVIDAADAALVAVPTVEHARVAGSLLRGGLDVLVEKPIASTREEARDLIEAAAAGERILQVGQVERFSSAFRGIAPILNKPRFIEAHRIGPFPGRATDVGVVLDLMIHDLDIVCSLAGSDAERVEAIGVPVLSATEDIANARVRFRNGCILNLTASRVSLEPLRKIRLFQHDAYISIDFLEQSVTVARRIGEPGGPEAPEIRGEKLELNVEDALLAQDRAFVHSVVTREAPEVTGEDGYRALDLALRIHESLPTLEELQA